MEIIFNHKNSKKLSYSINTSITSQNFHKSLALKGRLVAIYDIMINNRQHYHHSTNRISLTTRIIEEFVLRSWWVVLFFLICYACYDKTMQQQDNAIIKLDKKIVELKIDKLYLEGVRNDLLIQINSQSDYAWIELTLMKGLGVVPEGQTKVYFTKQDTENL